MCDTSKRYCSSTPNCILTELSDFLSSTPRHGPTILGILSIGCHVDIGASAEILGRNKMGSHTKIGADSLALSLFLMALPLWVSWPAWCD